MRRLVTLVLLCVMIGAPEAFAACQLVCASVSKDEIAGGDAHHGHAGHHNTTPDRGLDATRHGCGAHNAILTTGPSTRVTVAPAILGSVLVIAPPRHAVPTHDTTFAHALSADVRFQRLRI